jgi:hypothetical protein
MIFQLLGKNYWNLVMVLLLIMFCTGNGWKALKKLQFGGAAFGDLVVQRKMIGLLQMLVVYIFCDKNFVGFWKERWLGTEPLRDMFPSLFAKTSQPGAVISSMGSWVNKIGCGSLCGRIH